MLNTRQFCWPEVSQIGLVCGVASEFVPGLFIVYSLASHVKSFCMFLLLTVLLELFAQVSTPPLLMEWMW